MFSVLLAFTLHCPPIGVLLACHDQLRLAPTGHVVGMKHECTNALAAYQHDAIRRPLYVYEARSKYAPPRQPLT